MAGRANAAASGAAAEATTRGGPRGRARGAARGVQWSVPRGDVAVIGASLLAVVLVALAPRGPWPAFALVPLLLVLNRTRAERSRAEALLRRLLAATRALARVTDEREGARLVARLAIELFDADAAAVLLADRDGGSRYRNRAASGHPALADAAPLVLDLRAGDAGDGGRAGTAGPFLSHRAISASPRVAGRGGRARSVVNLTLAGDGPVPVGVVVVMWGARGRSLGEAARAAAELLSQDAGRMFTRIRSTAALARQAQTDPLTELANRRTFAHALATLQPGDAVVIVDLDHFKRVNDEYGHDAGDETLRALAGCLRRVSRQVDCVARYGGEEFALVLPEAGARGARVVLARLRRVWAAQAARTTFSAGIAVHTAGRRAEDTVRRADVALYEAKERGRDRDVVATEATGATLVLR